MKSPRNNRLLLLSICVLCLLMAVEAWPVRRQRTQRANYDALLQNKSYVQAQLRCMLEEGDCDRIGSRIKELLPDAIKLSKCPEECTEEERRYVPKIHDLVKKDYPEEYKRIRKIYADDVTEQDEE